jgi:hypothetical protein
LGSNKASDSHKTMTELKYWIAWRSPQKDRLLARRIPVTLAVDGEQEMMK